MALITCPDCGKQISDMCDSCPNCGRPINRMPAPTMQDFIEAQQIANENYAAGIRSEQLKKEFIIEPIVKLAIVIIGYYIIKSIYVNTASNPSPDDIKMMPFAIEAIICGIGVIYRNFYIVTGLIGLLIVFLAGFFLGMIILPIYTLWQILKLTYGLVAVIAGNKSAIGQSLSSLVNGIYKVFASIKNMVPNKK